jgi:hypothetical protein
MVLAWFGHFCADALPGLIELDLAAVNVGLQPFGHQFQTKWLTLLF